MENNRHLNELLENLIGYAKLDNQRAKEEPVNEMYYKGRRDSFKLAAKWLEEALIQIKYDNLYK